MLRQRINTNYREQVNKHGCKHHIHNTVVFKKWTLLLILLIAHTTVDYEEQTMMFGDIYLFIAFLKCNLLDSSSTSWHRLKYMPCKSFRALRQQNMKHGLIDVIVKPDHCQSRFPAKLVSLARGCRLLSVINWMACWSVFTVPLNLTSVKIGFIYLNFIQWNNSYLQYVFKACGCSWTGLVTAGFT